jgi:hypothetical protein
MNNWKFTFVLVLYGIGELISLIVEVITDTTSTVAKSIVNLFKKLS